MEENKVLDKQGWQMKKKQQQMLDSKIVTGPHEFMRSGILQAVVALIVTNNQVSLVDAASITKLIQNAPAASRPC